MSFCIVYKLVAQKLECTKFAFGCKGSFSSSRSNLYSGTLAELSYMYNLQRYFFSYNIRTSPCIIIIILCYTNVKCLASFVQRNFVLFKKNEIIFKSVD